MDAAISTFRPTFHGPVPAPTVDTNFKDSEDSEHADSNSFSNLTVDETLSPGSATQFIFNRVPETPCGESATDFDENETSIHESPTKIILSNPDFEPAELTIKSLIDRLKQFRSTAGSVLGGGLFDQCDSNYDAIASTVKYLINMLHHGWDHIQNEMGTGYFKSRLADLDTIVRSTPRLRESTNFVPDFIAALKTVLPDSQPSQSDVSAQAPQCADQPQVAAISAPPIGSDDTAADDQWVVPRQLLPWHKEAAIKDRLDLLSSTLLPLLRDETDVLLAHQLNEMRSKLNAGLDTVTAGELSLDLDDLLHALRGYGAKPSKKDQDQTKDQRQTELDFINPQLLSQFIHDPITAEEMATIREDIGNLQMECAVAWEIQNVYRHECSESINISHKKTVQYLINALRAMRPVLQKLEGGQICLEEVSALLLFLIQPTDKQNEAERRAVHQRVTECNEMLLCINSISNETTASLHCLKSHMVHLLTLSESLISGAPPVSTTGNAALLGQLLQDIQPLFSGTDGSDAGGHIITSLIVKLQGQRVLSCEDSILIASKLDALLKSLGSITAKFDAHGIPVEFIKTNVKYLQSIFQSSISALPNYKSNSNLKSDQGILVMLEAIRVSLTDRRPDTAQSLAEIEERLRKLSVKTPEEENQQWNTSGEEPTGTVDGQPAAETPEKPNPKAGTDNWAERRQSQNSRLKELAKISLALDEIAKQFPVEPPQVQNEEYVPPPEGAKQPFPITSEQIEQGKIRQLAFIKNNLSHLAFLAQARWAEEAHAAVVCELTDYYRKLWGMAYSEMTALGITGGLSIGALIPAMPAILDLVSAELGFTLNRGMVLDDENFPGRITSAVGSLTVKAGILTIVEGTLKGSKSIWGKYEEWDTARKYVLANFDKLVKSHSGYQATRFPKAEVLFDHRPMVSRYLNRHAALGQSSLVKEWALFRGHDLCRIDGIKAIQQRYNDCYQRISQSFSLLLSGLGTQLPGRDISTVVLDRFRLEDGAGLDLGLATDSGGGGVQGKVPVPRIDAHFYLGGERSNSEVELIVPTALCKKMAELRSDLSDCAADTQSPLTEIAKNGVTIVEDFQGDHVEKTALLNKISNEILTKSKGLRKNLDGHQTVLTARAMQASKETQALLAAQALVKEGRVYQAQADELPKPARYQWAHVYGAATNDSSGIAAEFEDLRGKLRSVQRDFQEYIRLQAQKSNAKSSKVFIEAADESIEEFHKLYCANDSVEFLYRVLLLNGWLCVSLDKVAEVAQMHPAIATQIALFKKENEFERFEDAVLKPPFDIDRKKLLDLFSIKKQAFLTIKDTKISIKANANLDIIDPKISKSFGAGVTLNGLFRCRRHTNPLRDGDSIDWEFRIGPNVGITPEACQSLLTKLCAAQRISDVPNVKEGLATYLADQPHLVSAGYERSFVFRSYKPSKELFPGLSSRRFYFRQNNVTALSFSPKVSFGSGFSAGMNVERNTTTFGSEKYQPDTIWYFLQRYFHDFGNNHISKTNGFHKEGYWLTIVRQQESSLQKIFKNFAKESESLNSPAADSLTAEFNALESAFRRRRISGADLQNIALFRAHFEQVARSFKRDPTSKNYQAALTGFQDLMYAYCPHIRKMKTNSVLFKNMEFSLTDTLPSPVLKLFRTYRRIIRPIAVAAVRS